MQHRASGFTLAELLIALAILGVIATFTIPKVLQSQQNTAWKSAAKETAAMISASYSAYVQTNGSPPSNMKPSALTGFMNYVKVDTTGTVDDNQTNGTIPCSVAVCLRLHNGGVLYPSDWENFAGTASTNVIFFAFDPDGKVTDGTTNGPGKSIFFGLYYNGRMTTTETLLPGSQNSNGAKPPEPGTTPPWFSWN